ncbi:MAG: SDR family oxidoreductase [Actinomycetota bacterium]|nr:SDR family oxidoreductase [Actinomycetota bacterium]
MTGAAGGIGRAITARFIGDGARAFLVDLDPSVEETAAQLGSRADGVAGWVASDVSCAPDVDAAADRALACLGGIDVVVNCAGIGGPASSAATMDPGDFRRVVEVNLVGTFLWSRAGARQMLGQETGGAIVNIASLFGQQGAVGAAAYGASKAGVSLLTQSMARELGPHGIRVNAVAPGHIATEMHWDELRARAARAGTSFEEERVKVLGEVPLGRHGTGADVAAVVAWLASDDAAYVTGQTIGVNGGVLGS